VSARSRVSVTSGIQSSNCLSRRLGCDSETVSSLSFGDLAFYRSEIETSYVVPRRGSKSKTKAAMTEMSSGTFPFTRIDVDF